MELLISICSGLAILFGIGLFLSPARGAFIASIISVGAGVFAYEQKSLLPLVIGFGLLWFLRIIGVEQK